MRNQLGAVTQTSFLTVNGGDVVASSDPTTGIIVVAVVCCILGTSLVWVFIIYHTRRRGNQQVKYVKVVFSTKFILRKDFFTLNKQLVPSV